MNTYQCGAQFFEKDFHVTTSQPVPMKLVSIDLTLFLMKINSTFEKVFTLCYIYIGLAVSSIILVAILLDQRRKKEETKSKKMSFFISLDLSIEHY